MRRQSADIAEVEVFITETREWLLQQSIDRKQWQEGLDICDEGLEYCASSSEETSFQRDELCRARERCEVALANESLVAAEAATDFAACLESLNSLEKLCRHQEETRRQPRHIFLLLGDKLIRFLRCCYKDGCIPCAKWARCSEDQPCIFDKKESQQHQKSQHDRRVFCVPFGCAHHCEGGYCFLD
jgi:hypothetical protein